MTVPSSSSWLRKGEIEREKEDKGEEEEGEEGEEKEERMRVIE